MTDFAVEIGSLAVRRGGRAILHVERLIFNAGEVVAILGPNGAGKSTLLKCILGFVRPTAGNIRALGQDVWPRGRLSLHRLRRRMGYVPQTLAAPSDAPLTVREVVAIGRTGIASLFRRLTPSDWIAIDDWLDRLGLANLARRRYAELSGGEQRKTLIAKAMVQEPEILVLDEPTANLDLYWREQIVGTLDALHGHTDLTIILVCHELEAIPPCAGRLLMLRQGQLIADGPPEQVVTAQTIETLYGTRLRLLSGGGRIAAVPVEEVKT